MWEEHIKLLATGVISKPRQIIAIASMVIVVTVRIILNNSQQYQYDPYNNNTYGNNHSDCILHKAFTSISILGGRILADFGSVSNSS